MATFFAMFGAAAGILAALALPRWRRRGLGERALERLGVLAGVISSSVMAAIVAIAFMGERLVTVASVTTFFAWGNLGEAAVLLVLMIFAAMGGLMVGCAAAVCPEGAPRLLPRWRYLQRRFPPLGDAARQAGAPGSAWREFAGRCLALSSVTAALLPVVVVYVLLASVDAARLRG